jgi:hypothetical protein
MTRMKRRIVYAAAGVVILMAAVLIVRRLLPTREKEVRKTIDRIARAVEAHDFDTLEESVSDRYAGEYEGGKAEALKSARNVLSNFENLKMDIRLAEVKVSDGVGKAVVLFNITGVYFDPEMKQKIPFRNVLQQVPGRPEQMYVEFENSLGFWRVSFVTWNLADRLADFPVARKRLAQPATGK